MPLHNTFDPLLDQNAKTFEVVKQTQLKEKKQAKHIDVESTDVESKASRFKKGGQ